MKVVVDKDEFYVFYATNDDPRRNNYGRTVLDVDKAIARRWKQARRDFTRAAEEIEAEIRKIKGE